MSEEFEVEEAETLGWLVTWVKALNNQSDESFNDIIKTFSYIEDSKLCKSDRKYETSWPKPALSMYPDIDRVSGMQLYYQHYRGYILCS